MPSFVRTLQKANKDRGLLICGLDPDFDRIPSHLIGEWRFNKTQLLLSFLIPIIKAVAPHVAGFKPNLSFYLDFDEAATRCYWGQDALLAICQYIRFHYPEHILILDAKDGDIGTSNNGYFRRAFEGYDAHALTWNSYLGPACLEQMDRYPGRGVIALARTSNQEGTNFQSTTCNDGRPIYMQSIDQWLKLWKKRYPIGLVAGATHLKDLRKIRKYAGAMPLLVPGVGPQGGALGNVVENGFGGKFGALMINLSREPLYASSDRKFAEAAGDKMRENRFMVTQQLSAIKRKQN